MLVTLHLGASKENMIHFILRMKLKMVMGVGILSLGLMFFTACIDVIANFVNSEPKETSKMIDIIAKDMKKVRIETATNKIKDWALVHERELSVF